MRSDSGARSAPMAPAKGGRSATRARVGESSVVSLGVLGAVVLAGAAIGCAGSPAKGGAVLCAGPAVSAPVVSAPVVSADPIETSASRGSSVDEFLGGSEALLDNLIKEIWSDWAAADVTNATVAIFPPLFTNPAGELVVTELSSDLVYRLEQAGKRYKSKRLGEGPTVVTGRRLMARVDNGPFYRTIGEYGDDASARSLAYDLADSEAGYVISGQLSIVDGYRGAQDLRFELTGQAVVSGASELREARIQDQRGDDFYREAKRRLPIPERDDLGWARGGAIQLDGGQQQEVFEARLERIIASFRQAVASQESTTLGKGFRLAPKSLALLPAFYEPNPDGYFCAFATRLEKELAERFDAVPPDVFDLRLDENELFGPCVLTYADSPIDEAKLTEVGLRGAIRCLYDYQGEKTTLPIRLSLHHRDLSAPIEYRYELADPRIAGVVKRMVHDQQTRVFACEESSWITVLNEQVGEALKKAMTEEECLRKAGFGSGAHTVRLLPIITPTISRFTRMHAHDLRALRAERDRVIAAADAEGISIEEALSDSRWPVTIPMGSFNTWKAANDVLSAMRFSPEAPGQDALVRELTNNLHSSLSASEVLSEMSLLPEDGSLFETILMDEEGGADISAVNSDLPQVDFYIRVRIFPQEVNAKIAVKVTNNHDCTKTVERELDVELSQTLMNRLKGK